MTAVRTNAAVLGWSLSHLWARTMRAAGKEPPGVRDPVSLSAPGCRGRAGCPSSRDLAARFLERRAEDRVEPMRREAPRDHATRQPVADAHEDLEERAARTTGTPITKPPGTFTAPPASSPCFSSKDLPLARREVRQRAARVSALIEMPRESRGRSRCPRATGEPLGHLESTLAHRAHLDHVRDAVLEERRESDWLIGFLNAASQALHSSERERVLDDVLAELRPTVTVVSPRRRAAGAFMSSTAEDRGAGSAGLRTRP